VETEGEGCRLASWPTASFGFSFGVRVTAVPLNPRGAMMRWRKRPS
jgi:hypothetical protein